MGNVFWGRQYHCEVCFDIDSMGAQLFAGFGPPCGSNPTIGLIFLRLFKSVLIFCFRYFLLQNLNKFLEFDLK